MAGNKVRYSLTFLNYANKDKAVNDEMMIDKISGALYYKREDGKIIKCTSDSSGGDSSTSFTANLYQSIINSGISVDKLFYTDPATGLFAVTEQKLDTNPSVSKDQTEIDNTFYVHHMSGVFFVDAETRSSDMIYLSLLAHLRNLDKSVDSTHNAKINYTIAGQLNGVDVEGSTKNFSTEITLNSPCPIELPAEYVNNDKYDLLKIVINSIECPVMDYYKPDEQSEMNLYKDILPDDGQFCYTKINLAYFTESTDTIFVDALNKVISITDSQSAVDDFTNGDLKSYIRLSIEPLILKLYNSGLSTSSSYVKAFDVSGWTQTDDGYEIEISKLEHMLVGEIVSHVYYYDDGLYKSDYGIWDDISYRISCNPTTKTIKLTTEEPFKGKIILIDNSKLGDIAYVASSGTVQITQAILSQYKRTN